VTISIDALAQSAARARVSFDAAARRLADATSVPVATAPGAPGQAPGAAPDVDVAEQMVAMMLASGVHQATLAAMRSAMASYKATLGLLRE